MTAPTRWLLHPVTAAFGLLVLAGFGTVVALATLRDPAPAGAVLLLALVAGAAAGFANSGST